MHVHSMSACSHTVSHFRMCLCSRSCMTLRHGFLKETIPHTLYDLCGVYVTPLQWEDTESLECYRKFFKIFIHLKLWGGVGRGGWGNTNFWHCITSAH